MTARRIRSLAAALSTLLVVLLAPAGAQEAGELTIDSVDVDGYPEVTAVLTAPDTPDGGGFDPSSFEVTEDDVPVDAAIERIASEALEVILVIDTSGSMEGAPLSGAKTAATEFLEAVPSQVRVGAVSFGPSPTLVAAPTTDRVPLTAGIAQLFASGETALYDAVIFASQQFTDDGSDRALLVLSDGGDTVSGGDLAAAVSSISSVRVDVIELVTSESDRASLDQLAAAGGGTVVATADPEALSDLYRLTADTLANQYRLIYHSSNGGDVRLTVRLNAPGTGILVDSRSLRLPVSDADAPLATSDPVAAASASEATSSPGDGSVGVRGLVLGAAAIFVALSSIGVVAVSGDGTRRRVRAGLGLHRPTFEAGTASRVKERMAADVDDFLERQGRKSSLEAALDVAGIALRPGEFIVLVLGAGLVAALVGLLVAGLIGAVVLLLLVPLVARAVVSRKARRRRAAFSDALPDNLQMLTSSLRSGYSLLQSLDAVAQEASEPARDEFRRVILEIRVGRDPNDALRALADRMQSEDFEWVVGAIEINRELGGDLAVILDTVSGTIRERQQVARQIRALTAEGRMSVWILTGLPIVLAFVLSAINPGYLDDLRTGAGLALVVFGAALLVAGWVWMTRLIRIDY